MRRVIQYSKVWGQYDWLVLNDKDEICIMSNLTFKTIEEAKENFKYQFKAMESVFGKKWDVE